MVERSPRCGLIFAAAMAWGFNPNFGASAPRPDGRDRADASCRMPPGFATSSTTGRATLSTSPTRPMNPSRASAAGGSGTSCGGGMSFYPTGATPDFPQGDPWSGAGPWGNYVPTDQQQQQQQRSQPTSGTFGTPMSPMTRTGVNAVSPPSSPTRPWQQNNIDYSGCATTWNQGQQTNVQGFDLFGSPNVGTGAPQNFYENTGNSGNQQHYAEHVQQPGQQVHAGQVGHLGQHGQNGSPTHQVPNVCHGSPGQQGVQSASAAPSGMQPGSSLPGTFAGGLASNLGMPAMPSSVPPPVTSAFNLLGKSPPTASNTPVPGGDELGRQMINALTGEKKTMPSWNGSPSTLRSWLKMLAFWEVDNSTPKAKWGLKLYQSFQEGSAPRKVADQIPTEVILSETGYAAILQALMLKYQPYLAIAAPASIDAFFFSGDRARGESFTSFIANKEIQRQEMNLMVGQEVNDLVCGRILLRQAGLSDLQRDLLSIKGTALIGFQQMSELLRTLDRSEVITKGTMANASVNKTFMMLEHGIRDGDDDQQADPEEMDVEQEGSESSEAPSDGFVYFEDREHTEVEAIYLQAYADVRRDLQKRKKERGFMKHKKTANPKRNAGSGHYGKGRGRGQGHFQRGGRRKGTVQELTARTRCFTCDELGHYAVDCPKRKKQNSGVAFVSSRGNQEVTTSHMTPNQAMVCCRSMHIFNQMTLRNFEALVDTGAEEGVMGSTAYEQIKDELLTHNLKDCPLTTSPNPCCGVGGQANPLLVTDIPIAVAGLHGVIRFTILEDKEHIKTPPLLPVSFLEVLGAKIDLETDILSTKWGHTTQLRRMNSRHRAVNILDFGYREWHLPHVHRGSTGEDPFQMFHDTNPMNQSVNNPPMLLPEDTAINGQPRPVMSGQNRPMRSRGRQTQRALSDRSRSPGMPTVHVVRGEVQYRTPPKDVMVWLKETNGSISHVKTVEGPVDHLIHPYEVFGDNLSHGLNLELMPRRISLLELIISDGRDRGPKYLVDDNWINADSRDKEYPYFGHVMFVEKPNDTSPQMLRFVPTGALPGERRRDLAQFFHRWGTDPAAANLRSLPHVAYKGAHSAVLQGEWELLSDFDFSTLPASSSIDVALLDATASRTPMPAADAAAQIMSSPQVFSLEEQDQDCEVHVENQADQNEHEFEPKFQWMNVLSMLRCKQRAKAVSNTLPSTSSADSRGLFESPILSRVRNFLTSKHGGPSLTDWSHGASSFGRRFTSKCQVEAQQEDSYGSLEAHCVEPPHDVGDCGQAISAGLQGEEGHGTGEREDDSNHVQGQEQESAQTGQECQDLSRHWQATTSLSSTRVLEERDNRLPPSCRISSLSRQPVRQVVGLSGVREPLGTSGTNGSFFIDCRGGAQVSRSPEVDRKQDGSQLSRIPASSTFEAGTRQPEVDQRRDGQDCLHASAVLGVHQEGVHAEEDPRTNDGQGRTDRGHQQDPRKEVPTDNRTSPSEPIQDADKEQLGVRGTGIGAFFGRLLGRRDDDDGAAISAGGEPRGQRVKPAAVLLSYNQLNAGQQSMWKSMRSHETPKNLMMLFAIGLHATFPLQWMSKDATKFELVFGPEVSQEHFVLDTYALPDVAEWVKQSEADLSGQAKDLPKKVKRTILANFKDSSNGQTGSGHDETGVDVMEVYSPPRVTARAKRFQLTHGGALDLATGWNFNLASHQRQALELISTLKPALIILSPPCTVFSTLRRLSDYKRNPAEVKQEQQEGLSHVKFSVQLARLQMKSQRGFLFEHPRRATSWQSDELLALKNEDGVFEVTVDMCAFGLKTRDGRPALKPTLLITNLETLANHLGRRCNGRHAQHQPLIGGRAGPAAIYTNAFVDAILRALRQHLQLRPEGRPPEDFWTFDGKQLTRHHVQPRMSLFNPSHVTKIPIPVHELADQRITVSNSADWTWEDNWRESSTLMSSNQRWTGVTQFVVADHMVLPPNVAQLAQWCASSGAHALYTFVKDETDFICEWHDLHSELPAQDLPANPTLAPQHAFPTHKILGGDDAVLRVSSTSSSSASSRPAAAEEDVKIESAADEVEQPRSSRSRRLPTIEEVKGEDALEDELDIEVERAGQEVRGPRQSAQTAEEIEEKSLHPELRREIYRLHRNLGHPDHARFVRALKHAGVRAEVLRWVKTAFKCPLCESRKRPHSQRPGHLSSQSLEFNNVVGLDIFYVRTKPFLNMICWGTDLMVVDVLPNKRSDVVLASFLKNWVGHYGPPRLVVCDQGREFLEPFVSKLAETGIMVHYIDSRSPWQNARTERAGGAYKSRLETVLHETTAETEEEFMIAVAETQIARNRYYNRAGFSPFQRAFGTTPRLPASLLSDDQLDRDLMQSNAGDEMKRAWEIRDAAAAAWMKSQDSEAIRRALKTNTRTTDLKKFEPNDVVYVWRNIADYHGWTGPGIVVAVTENQKSLWISLRGYLIKASREQVRHATSEESLGAQLVQELSRAMIQDVESGNISHYRDVEDEGGPDEPALPPHQDDEPPQAFPPMDVETEDAEMEPETPVPPPVQFQEFDMEDPTPVPQQMETDEAEVSTQAPTVAPDPEPPVPSSANTPTATTTPAVSRRTSIMVDEGEGGSMSFGPLRGTPERERPGTMPYPFSGPSPTPWPSPNANNTYFNIMPENDNKRVFWQQVRGAKTGIPKPLDNNTYELKNAVAMVNYVDKKIYITKAKLSPGQIVFTDLPPEQIPSFRKARDKEIKSLLDSGAIRILSVEDSLKFLKENADCVLDSRYVDRWKPTDAFGVLPNNYYDKGFKPHEHPGLAAKSRWCVVGWKDPMIHEIERSAPTPLTSSMYLFMQLCASRKWVAYSKDAKTAFLQSRPTTRTRKLACRMPKCETFPGYDPRQLILLETEVYGLVSGPAWWRRSFLELCVKEMGYRVNCYDRCVLSLDGEKNANGSPSQTQGLMVIEVDDILEAGNENHRKKMKWLEERLRFGKVENLKDSGDGSGYAGRRVKQAEDFGFSFHMKDYIQNRLKPIQIDRKVLKKNAGTETLTKDEEQQLRGVIAAVNWVSREGRPDASASASILSGVFPNATLQDAMDVNIVVQHLKDNDVTMRIHPIPEQDVRHVVIADSSFDITGKVKPQHGWIQGVSTPKLNLGHAAPFSIISWRSRRLRRKAGSTMMCEAISLSTALGALEKQIAVFESFRWSFFDPTSMTGPIETQLGLRGPMTVIAAEDPQHIDPNALAVIDAKAVYDGSQNEQAQGEDDRSALEIAVIQESLAKIRGRIRWVPHNRNPADGLTKLLAKAHMEPMMKLLRNHVLLIEEETDVIAKEKQSDCRQKLRA